VSRRRTCNQPVAHARPAPRSLSEGARMLAWRVKEYVGVPNRRGGYGPPTDPQLDCDVELWTLAEAVLAKLPKKREAVRRG
jgi:hypothetical protein